MPSTFPCPKCGEYHYHKSHTKNQIERIRKILLKQRPYRCHSCGHRQWDKKVKISGELTPKKVLYYAGVLAAAVFVGMLCRLIIT